MFSKILLIEDNYFEADLVNRALLKITGAKAEHVVNASQAYSRLLENPAALLPELIISDMDLPDHRGNEIVRKVREEDTTREIPFIILSSCDDQMVITQCYEAGANAYLIKPSNFSGYLNTLEKVFNFFAQEPKI